MRTLFPGAVALTCMFMASVARAGRFLRAEDGVGKLVKNWVKTGSDPPRLGQGKAQHLTCLEGAGPGLVLQDDC